MDNLALNHTEKTTNYVRHLLQIVANENDTSKKKAIPIAAEFAGVAPGTLERLDRERVKDVRVSVRVLIRSALLRKYQHAIQEAQNQIQKIIREAEAEIYFAKLTSSHPASDETLAGQTKLAEAIEAAKALTGGEGR